MEIEVYWRLLDGPIVHSLEHQSRTVALRIYRRPVDVVHGFGVVVLQQLCSEVRHDRKVSAIDGDL